MTNLLSHRARLAVLLAAIGALLFDGVELGLMPVASLSVSQSLLGADYTPTLGGDWFARFTAALMLGAAVGGIALGNLGDVVGRTRALGISIVFYSVFAGLGALVQTQEQMLVLRFLVGLGVGGVWPNAVALAGVGLLLQIEDNHLIGVAHAEVLLERELLPGLRPFRGRGRNDAERGENRHRSGRSFQLRHRALPPDRHLMCCNGIHVHSVVG